MGFLSLIISSFRRKYINQSLNLGGLIVIFLVWEELLSESALNVVFRWICKKRGISHYTYVYNYVSIEVQSKKRVNMYKKV